MSSFSTRQHRLYFKPVVQPASTSSPYDSISNAPINEIINFTKSVQIRSAPLSEIIDLTGIDSATKNHGLMNRVNQITRQIAVDAVGLESVESDMSSLVNFPSFDMEKKSKTSICILSRG